MSDSVLLLRRVRERSGEAAAAAGAGGGAPPGGPSPAPGPTPRRKRGRRRRFYPEHRVYRARSSFLDLSEEQVLRRYRLDKAAIAGLCRELGADLESLTGRSHALPVAVKVTSALTFLASGSFQTATRDSTGISQSAMSNCLAQFLEALQRRAARYIAFPAPGRPAPTAPGAGAFPGVLGLLGSMHVALRAPSENEVAFRNARNFHSMNMQVVCDAAGAITNVVAKFPGSCPNAAVLENSALARLLEGARPEGAWLLGDRSYPLKTWLMTPILFPVRGGRGALQRAAPPGAGRPAPDPRPPQAPLPLPGRGGGLPAVRPPEGLPDLPGLAACSTTSPCAAACPSSPPRAPTPTPSPELPLQAPHVQISSEARAVRARIVQQVKDSMG
nr:putative nuclease HARBI1 [Anas platyrhynchos]